MSLLLRAINVFQNCIHHHAGWIYGRKAHPDMSGINKAALDVIAPMLVVSAFLSKDFELLEQGNLLLCDVVIVLGLGILA